MEFIQQGVLKHTLPPLHWHILNNWGKLDSIEKALELSGEFLKITGLKEVSPEIKNNYISMVEKTISFEQIFVLSENVNEDEIQAVYGNEALILTFSSLNIKERNGVEEININ